VEPPSVSDRGEPAPAPPAKVAEALEVLGSLRRTTVEGTIYLLRQRAAGGAGQTIALVVAILNRMAEASASVELLTSTGRWRDAAVLALVLAELRLDLAYIAQRPDRAGTWLAHQEEGRKPWRVGAQIRELFTEEVERNAEFGNYRHLSMIKHANPASGVLGFDVHASAEGLGFNGNDIDVSMSLACLAYAGLCLRSATESAAELVQDFGLNTTSMLEEVGRWHEALQLVLSDHVKAEILELFGSQ